MKSELGKALQEIMDDPRICSPTRIVLWNYNHGYKRTKHKAKTETGLQIYWTRGKIVGGPNSDRPKRFHVRQHTWKAKEGPRGYAGDC